MKALMLPLIAFVVFFAIGGGAGAYAMKPTADVSMPTDSLHAVTAKDSAHTDHPADSATIVPHADPATVVPHRVDSDTATPVPPTTPTSTANVPHATNGSTPPSPLTIAALVRDRAGATVTMRPDGTIGPERHDTEPDFARMASLLAKMGAREAARTIEEMSSGDAARALAAMSDKQAAAVLSQLKPEKAAALLRSALALVPRTATP
jgi:MgtE intracellular N domain